MRQVFQFLIPSVQGFDGGHVNIHLAVAQDERTSPSTLTDALFKLSKPPEGGGRKCGPEEVLPDAPSIPGVSWRTENGTYFSACPRGLDADRWSVPVRYAIFRAMDISSRSYWNLRPSQKINRS